MENSFNFFDSIYCINLNKRIDRWLKVKQEFEKIGILDKVKRFNAIERQDGRIGCIKSHIEILKLAKKENLNNVLIFEDDVTFLQENTSDCLSTALSQLPENWTLLYLGANIHNSLESYSDNLIRIKNGYSTHAIAYHKSIFDFMINKYDNFNVISNSQEILDVWISINIQGNPYYNCFLIKPLLATQINDYSDIEHRQIDYSFIQERFNRFIKK
jgi:glycosyl transferase family 25